MPHNAVSGGSIKTENSTSNALDMHSSGVSEDESIADLLQILDDDGMRAAVGAWTGPGHLKAAILSIIAANA